MIVAENKKPPLTEFTALMKKADILLNYDASQRQNYYLKRSGKLLEEDVKNALINVSKNTSFEGSIKLVSGQKFPDIVAKDYYGVEVKSSQSTNWQSTGSSILESTRVSSVERIFLTFGKLVKPVEFLSKPYEDCLNDIVVTHYPRYKINMKLKPGETIFDKLNIPYDVLRKEENPVEKISDYYTKQLKPGETLWWANNNNSDTVSPPILRVWNTLTPSEKNDYTVLAFALFPQIFSSNTNIKYNDLTLYLIKYHGIVNPNCRDQFSAGGKRIIKINKAEYQVPAIIYRAYTLQNKIEQFLNNYDEEQLKQIWKVKTIKTNRLKQWWGLVKEHSSKDNEKIIYAIISI